MNRKLIVVGVLAPLIVGLALILYTWPAARSQPRDVPVGVVAAATQSDAIIGQLAAQGGAFSTRQYPTEDAARTAIVRRQIDAAVITNSTPPLVLVASAGGPALVMEIEPMLTKVAGTNAMTEDVVATPPTDPKGTVLAQGVLPLTLAGEVSGIMLALALRPGKRQVGVLFGVSAVTGIVCWAITGAWLDVLGPATWWIAAGGFAFTILAIGSIVLGLHALLGRAGLPLAFVLLAFLGNAWAGTSSAPELLPPAAHRVGQWLPPGAGNELLRSIAFFHGHGSTHSIVVLGIWTVLGNLAAIAGKYLADRRTSSGRHEANAAPAAVQPASG